MLHELLLALSGHPSPLLSLSGNKGGDGAFENLLSPAESALLRSFATDLGETHNNIRSKATIISAQHPSTVCRAVATSIFSTHLARFQQRILEVEKDILEENPSIVGAYNIVPLSGLVGAFDGWNRKLQWLWSLVLAIEPTGEHGVDIRGNACSTASRVLERLRESTYTGFPDIEQIALELVKVAETAWLKHISAWILYGRLPASGGADCFITCEENGESQGILKYSYGINPSLVPNFVTRSTASSILFIGKSLNHIREREPLHTNSLSRQISPDLALLPKQLAHLASLSSPITPAGLSAAVGAIRFSLSKTVLQKLLPISKVLELLRVLRDFFLLERGEFAVAILAAADERLSARHSRPLERFGKRDQNDLSNMVVKEGEVSAVLARTWATLASLQPVNDDEEEEVDTDLDVARELLKLSIKSEGTDSAVTKSGKTGFVASAVTFDDLLFPTSTMLTICVPSPLDLFLALSDVDTYSNIHSYLLAIRRAHLRLSKLFTLSVLRRDHPSPKGPPHSNHSTRFEALGRIRRRADHRAKRMRPIWATASHAALLLAEIGEYFQGEVMKSSWEEFLIWLQATENATESGEQPPLMALQRSSSSAGENQFHVRSSFAAPALHDPESLALAHRKFLSTLAHSLLLDDTRFTKQLKALMTAVDHLFALMTRLNSVQQNLDLETDVGVVDTFANYAVEERELHGDLQNARSAIASGIEGLVQALRDVDNARALSGRYHADTKFTENEEFTPKSGGGIDRLLLKLDFARIQD